MNPSQGEERISHVRTQGKLAMNAKQSEEGLARRTGGDKHSGHK